VLVDSDVAAVPTVECDALGYSQLNATDKPRARAFRSRVSCKLGGEGGRTLPVGTRSSSFIQPNTHVYHA